MSNQRKTLILGSDLDFQIALRAMSWELVQKETSNIENQHVVEWLGG
jgi:hypothetical protein